jgi:hypothetical protein
MFCVIATGDTPTAHATRSFRLSTLRAPHILSLDIWVGFGNGDKHAGDTTPSTDPAEAVPANDPARSGKATRDGFQPVAFIDTDAMTMDIVTHSVNDEAYVSHVAMDWNENGYTISGLLFAGSIPGAIVRPTTASRTGVPHSAQFRNTEANTATHRQRARERGNALMEHGRRAQGGE